MGIVIYQNGKKAAQNTLERVKTEQSEALLRNKVGSLLLKVYNSDKRYKKLENQKQQFKYIYREIKTTIDTLDITFGGGLDERLLSNGFHPLLPCK